MKFKADTSNIMKGLNAIDPVAVDAVIKLNMTEIYNRGKQGRPWTPVRTGELRQSLGLVTEAHGYAVGYTKEYAPAVEYGHRTRGGGWVNGQHYLQSNVNAQRPRLERDIAKLVAEWGRS